jgi:hypothetical protein
MHSSEVGIRSITGNQRHLPSLTVSNQKTYSMKNLYHCHPSLTAMVTALPRPPALPPMQQPHLPLSVPYAMPTPLLPGLSTLPLAPGLPKHCLSLSSMDGTIGGFVGASDVSFLLCGTLINPAVTH